MENKEIEEKVNENREEIDQIQDKTVEDHLHTDTLIKSNNEIISSHNKNENDELLRSSKLDKFMSSPLKAETKKIISNSEEEKNIDQEIVTNKNSSNKENKLVFTFKEKENNNEIKSYNHIKQNNVPSDYLFMLETENNLKLFEKKYELFRKNSVFNSSSLTREVNSKLSKYEEGVMTSCENLQTVSKSYNNFKGEKNSDCHECKYTIDNLLLEKNQLLENITKLQKLDQINQEKVERYLRELENLRSKDQIIKRLTGDNSNYKKTVSSLKKDIEDKSNALLSIESNYNKLVDKCSNIEYEKSLVEKKLTNLEYKFRSLKQDYENSIKTSNLLRRENEKLLNKTEEMKIKLYNMEQDNIDLRNKITKNEKNISTMKKEIAFINYKERNSSVENRQNLNKSPETATYYVNDDTTKRESRLLRSASGKLMKNNELMMSSSNNFYSGHGTSNPNNRYRRSNSIQNFNTENAESKFDKKLSDLLVKKANIENEMLKLPTKQKTLNQINRKIILEEELIDLENEINDCRLKIKSFKV